MQNIRYRGVDTLEKSFQKDLFVNAEVLCSYKLIGKDLKYARKQAIIEVDHQLVHLQHDVKHHAANDQSH